jgi:hypothetical protein
MYLKKGWSAPFYLAGITTLVFSNKFYLMSGREPIIWTFSLVFYLLFFLPAIFSALGKIQERLFGNGSVVLVPGTFALIYWMTCYSPTNLSILLFSAVACLSFYFSHYLNKEWNKIQSGELIDAFFNFQNSKENHCLYRKNLINSIIDLELQA